MKRSKFSERQFAYILRQAKEGTSVEEVCRTVDASVQTYLSVAQEVWRSDAAGDEAPEAA